MSISGAQLEWLKQRAAHWLEKGLLSPRHVKRIFREEGESAAVPLPAHYAVRATAAGAAGIALLAVSLWHDFFTGPPVLPWGARLGIALVIMAAGYVAAVSWLADDRRQAWVPVAAAVALGAFAFAYLALAEGIGLTGGAMWSLLLTGLTGLALSWFLRSRLLLVVSTVALSGWMVERALHQQAFNIWFPILMLLIVLPLTLQLRCRLNLVLVGLALPAWLGLATKPRFSPVELFLPFVFLLWGATWLLASFRAKLREEGLAEVGRAFGYVFLLGSAGVLSLHALGVALAKAVLAHPGWRTGEGLPLLVTSVLLIVVSAVLLITETKAGTIGKTNLVFVALPVVAVLVYLLVPERIPEELAGSLLPDYFLVVPFAFGLITLLLLFLGTWHGYASGDGFLFYLCLVGLAVFAGVRFFDSIWASLPKTFFFYLNGIGLVALWIVLQQRKVQLEKSE